MTRTRHRFTPTERRHIARRDLYLCRYCGWPVWPWQDDDIGHEISFQNGGSDDYSNLAYTHSHCNRSAGAADMKPSQRLSTVTIIILATVIGLALLFIVANAADASSNAPQPDEPTWSTEIAIKRAAIKIKAKIGQTQAARVRCGPAMYHFGISLQSWNLRTVRTQNRLGWQALRKCRQ